MARFCRPWYCILWLAELWFALLPWWNLVDTSDLKSDALRVPVRSRPGAQKISAFIPGRSGGRGVASRRARRLVPRWRFTSFNLMWGTVCYAKLALCPVGLGFVRYIFC